jgi:hypothetical protein
MHSEGADPQDTAPLSLWGARLLATVTVALAVSLVWLWIEVFYRGVSANVQLSFKAWDPLYMPPDPTSTPVIGRHHFGDFQLQLTYARQLRNSISPYFNPILPEQYPPISQLLFVPLSYLSLRTSSVIYFALSIAVFIVPLWLLLAPRRVEYGIIFLMPVAVLSTGFISSLDRGNNVIIALGLIAWALWCWRHERWAWCGVLIVAAIGLKAYPAALLIVPLALRRYRFTLAVAASAAAVNLLAVAFYAGGFWRNLRAVIDVLALSPPISADPLNQLYSWSLYSVIPKTAGLLFGPTAADRLLAPASIITWLPSIAYVCGLFFVIRRGRVPQWCWGPLALASTQVLVPVSYGYTSVWAAVGAVWFARGSVVHAGIEDRSSTDKTGFVMLRILLLLALTVTLTPSVFTISGTGGFETAVAAYLSPLLLALTMGVAVVQSLHPTAVHDVPELVD